jgi:DNA-binding transcriptional ArsR family regulator
MEEDKSVEIEEIEKAEEEELKKTNSPEGIDKEEIKTKALELLNGDCPLFKIKQILDKTIVKEDKNKLMLFLLLLSKNLGKDLAQAIFTIAPAGAGKSYMSWNVLRYIDDVYDEKKCPEGKILWLTRSSTHGLEYYMKKFKDLTGYILYVEQAPGIEEAQQSIMPIFTEKGLKVVVAMIENGKPIAKELNIEGCPVFLTNATRPIRSEEMSSRVWILEPDTSEEQTKEIQNFQKQLEKFPFEKRYEEDEKLLKTMVKTLETPDGFLIPFVDAIEFPTKQVRTRRDFPRFLALMKLSCYLHQLKRKKVEIENKKYLIVTFADYYIATRLAEQILKPTLYGLNETALKIYETCKKLYKSHDGSAESLLENPITSRTVAQESGLSQTTCSIYLKALVNAGLLAFEKIGRENYYTIVKKEEISKLLDVEKIYEKFNPEKFKSWLEEIKIKTGQNLDISYEDIIGQIYDPCTGEPHPIYIKNNAKTKDDSLSSFNKESDALIKNNKESDNRKRRLFMKSGGENNVANKSV